MPLILSGNTGTSTLDSSNGLTFSDSSLQGAAASPYVLKNRIINGDMRIDQRNAGASVTGNNGVFPVDRFGLGTSQSSKCTTQQNAGSVTPPAGFTSYMGITSTSAYSILSSDFFQFFQKIEGYNIADLAWGTVDAKTITLSFWVRSSLTGTFGGSIRNYNDTYAYCYSYTISSANTWEYKTITITGPTSGTWLTTNGLGIDFRFSYGMGSTYTGTAGSWGASSAYAPTGQVNVLGTNGATWYITGLQFEIGTTATPFERRLYGQEFDLCRRYCEVYSNPNLNFEQDGIPQGIATVDVGGRGESQIHYYPKRASPTVTVLNNNLFWQNMANTNSTCTFAGTLIGTGINSALCFVTVSGACVVGALSGVGCITFTNIANRIIISAEL